MNRELSDLISRGLLEPPPDLEVALHAEAIKMYREAVEVQKKAAALNFPETIRFVTEYFQNGASDIEKKIILSALMEGLRLIRKAAKREPSSNHNLKSVPKALTWDTAKNIWASKPRMAPPRAFEAFSEVSFLRRLLAIALIVLHRGGRVLANASGNATGCDNSVRLVFVPPDDASRLAPLPI